MSRSVIHIAFLILISFALLNCAATKDRTVPVTMVDVEPEIQKEGPSTTKSLQYVEKETWAYLEVIERSPNVKSVSRVTNNEKEDVYMGFVDYSPIEDVFIYSMTEKIDDLADNNKSDELKDIYTNNIWKQKVGSFARSRLTYGNRIDIQPSFTKNGKQVIFSSDRSGRDRKIWMLNIEGGGGLRMITSTTAEDFSPYASRTENILTYASIPEGATKSQVWTIDLEGRLATQLREGATPRISPDGDWISFLRKDNDHYCDNRNKDAGKGIFQVWKMTIEGDEETQLTMNEDFCVRDSMWSPDGKMIVFSSNENIDSNKLRNFDIWVMAADGTQKVQLTTNGSMDILPTFDRAGEYIYFVSNRGGKWNIWRFKPVFY